ncbi:carboxymuconolactone decarboxylase family protein [Coraliomargarita sp. SDUM461004]|uniref:Alkyl hydroperoxide reductase AhpD n=1 Tax=Thalassobacterium sedimentorum TaxID=3041258 RepID=A0ABU1AMY0_9BACT|nr:carboxymuconolactone decarboxylase family protein [Coraliomargarita sp. SDUM461004]MDQ8196156.1 carboxymuconolactone decarboxylase family protein [Coraliomargarita sp. SDUM461004]
MEQITELLASLPAEAKDLRINLKRVLEGESLDTEQTWGTALAAAYYIRHPELTAAVLADAKAAGISEATLEDARAAASIMGMNTIYYRFRHLMNSDEYNKRPANLRMMRMQQVASSKVNFELFSIGPAALAGCEMCLKAHEAAVKKDGMNEDNVHDAVRISAILHGVAVALDSI